MFDPIETHLLIETRVFVNNVISHSKNIRNSHHCIDDPFLDQPVDYHQKWQNPEQMITLLIIWTRFDLIEPHLPIETLLWVNKVISHKDTLQIKQCMFGSWRHCFVLMNSESWLVPALNGFQPSLHSLLTLALFLKLAGRVTQFLFYRLSFFSSIFANNF